MAKILDSTHRRTFRWYCEPHGVVSTRIVDFASEPYADAVRGAGVIMPFFAREYQGNPKISDLATWPAFYMGVGNLLAIPVAHAVGRRPVYLLATILLAFGCLWCAKSKSLGSHIAGRNVMSIAAGQAEALCPIIVQEIFYLHQRGRIIAYFCALQTLGTASLFVASSYLANNWGWRCKFEAHSTLLYVSNLISIRVVWSLRHRERCNCAP